MYTMYMTHTTTIKETTMGTTTKLRVGDVVSWNGTRASSVLAVGRSGKNVGKVQVRNPHIAFKGDPTTMWVPAAKCVLVKAVAA